MASLNVTGIFFFDLLSHSLIHSFTLTLSLSDVCDEYLLWKKESKKEKSKDSSSFIHSSTDNDHVLDDYVHQVERPFVIASIITMIFVTVGGISSFLGLSAAIYNTISQPNHATINLHISVILFSASTILIGSLLYVLFTFSSLHGGYYYAAGVYGMAYITVINILFSILIAMNEQKRQGYSQIVEMPSRATSV